MNVVIHLEEVLYLNSLGHTGQRDRSELSLPLYLVEFRLYVYAHPEYASGIDDGLRDIPEDSVGDVISVEEEAEEGEDYAAREHDTRRGVLYDVFPVHDSLGDKGLR